MKTIFGYMPNNKQSCLERDEFVIECDKHQIDYILFENYDHVNFEEVYNKENTRRTELENGQKGPGGDGTASNFASMVSIWRLIVELNETCAVFEHDARPVTNLNDVTVRDDEIVLLGPRVPTLDYYTYPENTQNISYIEVKNHAGGHAYAITPNTAKKMIEHVEKMGVCDSFDQWFFMRIKQYHVGNFLDLKLMACDPPVAVCVNRREGQIKKSTRNYKNEDQAEYNFYETPNFRKGLNNENL